VAAQGRSLPSPRSPLGVVDVVVHVADVNDNDPVVRRPRRTNATFVVHRLLPVGHVITRVEASDADDGHNARLTFSIINGAGGRREGLDRDEGPLFIIDDTSGDIVTSRDIERDDVGRYTLLIAVSDAGLPRRLTTTQIVVIINVTGGQVAPPAGTSPADETDYTVAQIVSVCCVAVLLKLSIVAVLCVRHNVALRVHASGTSSVTHKVSVGDQDENEANDKATTSSAWKRLHADCRTDAIPSSYSVSHS